MPVWLVEPRDPLIVRDGRPFGPDPGARASTLAFPFPSTTTGGVRTRAGLQPDGTFDVRLIPTVQQIAVRGPLLVHLQDNDEIQDWLLPAPADALFLRGEPAGAPPRRQRLFPLQATQAGPDLGALHLTMVSDLDEQQLKLVGPISYHSGKPLKDAPRYWTWTHFAAWLLGVDTQDETVPADLGYFGPQEEARMHVSIAPETQTAAEGALFRTAGLEFTYAPRNHRSLKECERLALAVESAAEFAQAPGAFAPLGGERRLVQWHRATAPALLAASPSSTEQLDGSTCPQNIRTEIATSSHCRLVLLTPAYFQDGFRPGTGGGMLCDASGSVQVTIEAMALPRPQVVSGWDFLKGQPKLTRRLVPAGTVFFLELTGDATALDKWITDHWLHCVSDDPQDQRDGFGLAVLGTWDGQLRVMQMEEPPHA